MTEPRTTPAKAECECPVEGHDIGCPNDLINQVCPGCYAVAAPCLPGCIDAEIARHNEDDGGDTAHEGAYDEEGS